MKLELHIDFVQLLISRAHEVDLWKKKKRKRIKFIVDSVTLTGIISPDNNNNNNNNNNNELY